MLWIMAVYLSLAMVQWIYPSLQVLHVGRVQCYPSALRAWIKEAEKQKFL